MNVTKAGQKFGSPLLSGLICAFLFSLVLTIVLSLLLWLTGMRESSLSTATYIIHAIALLVGGFVAGRKGESKGWYHGAMLGTAYAVLLMLTGFLAFDAVLGWAHLLMLLGAAAVGTLGGMFGVNTGE